MKKILIIEDEDIIKKYLVRKLKNDFEVVTCCNIDQARELMDASFYAVVSDNMLPKGNGITLLAEVKNKFPHIKRILITTFYHKREEDAFSVLLKPFFPEDLFRLLSEKSETENNDIDPT